MAQKLEVEVVIDKNGNVSLDVLNGQGPSCLSELEPFIQALGATSKTDKKPVFYQNVSHAKERATLKTGKS